MSLRGDVTLLSGVVRNRKGVSVSQVEIRAMQPSDAANEHPCMPDSRAGRLWDLLCTRHSILRNFRLRVHKFTFQWDLAMHSSLAIMALSPFLFSGSRVYAIIPFSFWLFYNVLFMFGKKSNQVIFANFASFRETFRTLFEEFFSPKLLPILSISYLLVILSLSVTGRRLGGPPLCFSSCHVCLSKWESAQILDISAPVDIDLIPGIGCGYTNGKELLALYTMAQTSFLPFVFCIIAMAVCMAWKVAEEEVIDRSGAEGWLKKEDMKAFHMREEIKQKFGSPGSSLRPEGNAIWVFCGMVAALTFTLLGWPNWLELPPSSTATLLIILNLLTILASIIMLHLSFFGRLLALYNRNKLRVEYLTTILKDIKEDEVEVWWNCRNFVLNDDLALDYDTGGLAVSITFIMNLLLFVTVLVQVYREGLNALLEPPGSYCGYACLYITMCLMKIFSFAVETYEEQHRHISELMNLSASLNNNEWSPITPIQTPSNASNTSSSSSSSSHQYNKLPVYNIDDDLGLNYEDEEHFQSKIPDRGGSNNSININNNSSNGNSSRLSLTDNSAALMNAPIMSSNPVVSSGSVGLTISIPSSSSSSSGSTSQLSPRKLSSTIQTDTAIAANNSSNSISNINNSNNESNGGNDSLAVEDDGNNNRAIELKIDVNAVGNDKNNNATKKLTTNYQESKRQTIADMIMQIRRYDPYPCILGIPVMPALFTSWKTYIFICIILVGARCLVFSLKSVTSPNNLSAIELAERVGPN